VVAAYRFFHMGLAALHAAREPSSLCMSVVPFETAEVAVFRRRLFCDEDADSTGGRPAFFERAGAGDFFLAAMRSLLSKIGESWFSTIRQGRSPLAEAAKAAYYRSN
jgi:hypothetical protein